MGLVSFRLGQGEGHGFPAVDLVLDVGERPHVALRHAGRGVDGGGLPGQHRAILAAVVAEPEGGLADRLTPA